MNEIKIDEVIISKQHSNSENYKIFNKLAKQKNITIKTVNIGDIIKIDKDLCFDILWPNDNEIVRENILNNNSIVCKMMYKNKSILFTGDIEKEAENKILTYYKSNLEKLSSDILKIAHHGSNTSTTEDFLSAVNPKIALIGVGEENKFGHPNDSIIARLNEKKVKIYRTDKMGEIFIRINNKCYKIIENNSINSV